MRTSPPALWNHRCPTGVADGDPPCNAAAQGRVCSGPWMLLFQTASPSSDRTTSAGSLVSLSWQRNSSSSLGAGSRPRSAGHLLLSPTVDVLQGWEHPALCQLLLPGGLLVLSWVERCRAPQNHHLPAPSAGWRSYSPCTGRTGFCCRPTAGCRHSRSSACTAGQSWAPCICPDRWDRAPPPPCPCCPCVAVGWGELGTASRSPLLLLQQCLPCWGRARDTTVTDGPREGRKRYLGVSGRKLSQLPRVTCPCPAHLSCFGRAFLEPRLPEPGMARERPSVALE